MISRYVLLTLLALSLPSEAFSVSAKSAAQNTAEQMCRAGDFQFEIRVDNHSAMSVLAGTGYKLVINKKADGKNPAAIVGSIVPLVYPENHENQAPAADVTYARCVTWAEQEGYAVRATIADLNRTPAQEKGLSCHKIGSISVKQNKGVATAKDICLPNGRNTERSKSFNALYLQTEALHVLR